jgi:hypothetical protein
VGYGVALGGFVRCSRWWWGVLVDSSDDGGCDYCFFIANKNTNNNNNKIINKNKTGNYVENTCQTNFLFSNLL